MNEQQVTPLELLTRLSEAGARNALQLPDDLSLAENWRGIGFRMAGHTYVTPMSEVDEVLTLPSYTKVPGVKSWLNGIANIRGRLLAVVDLGAMLGMRPCANSTKARLLTIKKDDLYSGVIVDEVLGLQTFSSLDQVEGKAQVAETEAFVSSAFKHEDQHWSVFSMYQLADAPEFLSVTE